jgi:hypothetical protein
LLVSVFIFLGIFRNQCELQFAVVAQMFKSNALHDQAWSSTKLMLGGLKVLLSCSAEVSLDVPHLLLANLMDWWLLFMLELRL